MDLLTGERADGRPALPWLSAHCWLLESHQFAPEGIERERVEKALFLGMFFTYLAVWLNEAILDPDSVFDSGYEALVVVLHEESRCHFEQLLPDISPFWRAYEAIHIGYRSALAWQSERLPETGNTFQTADWQEYGNRLALIKIGLGAALFWMNRPEDWPRLSEMVDLANQAALIREEILALRRDLGRGRLSYPIRRTLALAGLESARPFNIEQVLGAAVLTGSIRRVCGEAAERLAQSRQIAADLSLPGWQSYCDEVEQSLGDIQTLFSLKAGSGPIRPVSLLPFRDSRQESLRMAAGFLLADPAFGESVEVNRGHLEGLAEATGLIFPYSFISYLLLENGHALTGKGHSLAGNGHSLAVNVDEIFRRMERLGYRYYENMAVAPDTDETAILLRLFKYSQNQEQHRRQLERPLGWLINNITDDGRIPAFWNRVDVPVLERMVVWENYCLTAEINTLIGLIEYDWLRFQPVIEKSALGVFGRYLESDFGLVAYYDLLYSLWQALVLARLLEVKTVDVELIRLVGVSLERLHKRLALEASREEYSPQQAAFLMLACLDGRQQSLLNPEWATFLVKTQRYDGSWDNEPFYITCDRYGLPSNWYSSRSMTTAFCYHALNSYEQSEKRP